jgi:hypothetical protein
MSEKDTRKAFCALVPQLDPVPIENLLTGKTGIGTPDVETTAGHVELKILDGFPARETTVVRIPHLTDEQRDWHQRRYLAGEMTWLVVQVRREWFVFRSEQIPHVGTDWTRLEWTGNAWAHFKTKPAPEQMQTALLKGWYGYTKPLMEDLCNRAKCLPL